MRDTVADTVEYDEGEVEYNGYGRVIGYGSEERINDYIGGYGRLGSGLYLLMCVLVRAVGKYTME